MAAEIFYAEDGEIYICPNGSDLDASSTSRERYKYSDYVSEISVGGGARDTEQILLFGQNASDQQNSINRELPQEMYEASITAITKDESFTAMVNGDASTSGGVDTVSGAGSRTDQDIYYRFDDGTSQIQIKFSESKGVSTEMSADSEGYLEETTSFNCLAKNYEFKYAADRSSGSIFAYSGAFS